LVNRGSDALQNNFLPRRSAFEKMTCDGLSARAISLLSPQRNQTTGIARAIHDSKGVAGRQGVNRQA
jgi:hypothetical protein